MTPGSAYAGWSARGAGGTTVREINNISSTHLTLRRNET
jgi:hypothetical protein